MLDFLSDLYLSFPFMRRVCLFAVVTLKVGHREFDYDLFLKHCVLDFSLNRKFDLKPSRMRLCPDEGGVHELDLLSKAFYLLE